jgi:hypothetical protein
LPKETIFPTGKEFVLTIMSYHDCIIFTTGLFVLKQAPQAIEWLEFAYPTRPHNFNHIRLHNATRDSATEQAFISQSMFSKQIELHFMLIGFNCE